MIEVLTNLPQMLRQEGATVIIKPVTERKSTRMNDRRLVANEDPATWIKTKMLFFPYRSQKGEVPGDLTVSTSWAFTAPNIPGLRRMAIVSYNGMEYDLADDGGASSTHTNRRRGREQQLVRWVIRLRPGQPAGQPLSGKYDTPDGIPPEEVVPDGV